MKERKPWVGLDLDATLAEYHGWKGADHIGAPIPAMVDYVKRGLEYGFEYLDPHGKLLRTKEAKIFTARVYAECECRGGDGLEAHSECMERLQQAYKSRMLIREFCQQHLGRELEITYKKDPMCVLMVDDRCAIAIPNTGIVVSLQRLQHIVDCGVCDPCCDLAAAIESAVTA